MCLDSSLKEGRSPGRKNQLQVSWGKGQVRAQDQLLNCPPPGAPRGPRALRDGGGWASSAVSRDPASSPRRSRRAQVAEHVCSAFSPDPRVNGSLPCLVLGRRGGCSSRLSLSWALLSQACSTLCILFSYIQLSQKWSFAPPSAFSLLSSGGFRRKEVRTSSS